MRLVFLTLFLMITVRPSGLEAQTGIPDSIANPVVSTSCARIDPSGALMDGLQGIGQLDRYRDTLEYLDSGLRASNAPLGEKWYEVRALPPDSVKSVERRIVLNALMENYREWFEKVVEIMGEDLVNRAIAHVPPVVTQPPDGKGVIRCLTRNVFGVLNLHTRGGHPKL